VTGFWTWLWGPIGLVLSTPLTVCIVVLGRYVPQLYFFDVLVSDRAALTPPTVFYQRLLARDQDEATELVHEYQQKHTLNEVYDDVIAPALLLAWQDRRQGTLEAPDRTFILNASEEIIEDARASGQEATTPESSPPVVSEARDTSVIIGCPAHDETEELFVQMVGALLQQQGQRLEALTTHLHVSEIVLRIKQISPAVLFIATLPGGLPQARHLCRAVRRESPSLPIVVGYWGDNDTFDRTLTQFRQAGAAALTTSIQQSCSRIQALANEDPTATPAQPVIPVAQAAS
jgi:hypothetical protein